MLEGQGLSDLAVRRSRMLGRGDRRGLVLSTTSTVIVLAALLAVFLLAPGSRQVRHTFFNPTDMWRAFVGNPKAGYYSVGEALWLNIRIFILFGLRVGGVPGRHQLGAPQPGRGGRARSACRSGPRCGT